MKKVISIALLAILAVASAFAGNPKYNGRTLGVLGGMGPAASAEFMRLMAVKAPATIDQEHPRIILLSAPGTPDRTAYILGKGEDPEPYLIDGLQTLSGWGADILAVTCNTAHYYINRFRNKLDKPVVHIVEETVRASRERSPEGAWLTATLGTMKTGIYQNYAEENGYSFLIPPTEIQPDIHEVTDLVKAGKYDEAGKLFRKVCKKLWAVKKVPVVAACTEIPIAYQYTGLPEDMCVSSLDALADGCIRELYSPLPETGKEIPVTIDGAKGKLKGLVRLPDGVKAEYVKGSDIKLLNGAKCPVAILCHGLGSRKNTQLLVDMADSLACHGIASVRFDFNGHGESEGSFTDMNVLNEVEDLHKIFNYVESLSFTDGIALAGHSQGGIVSGLFAPWVGAERLKCLVLLAPGGIIVDAMREGKFFGVEFDPANPPEEIKIGKNLYGISYIKTGQILPVWEEAAKYSGPTIIIHSYDDKVVPYSYGEKYHEVMPQSIMVGIENNDHSYRKDRSAAVRPAMDFIIRNLSAER